MLPPTPDLRRNRASWAVPTGRLPFAAAVLLGALPREAFDPAFRGQDLATTYLDTADFALRKARVKGDQYLTLRVRCYRNPAGAAPDLYALSAKTEGAKFRVEVPADEARFLLAVRPTSVLGRLLPADLFARLLDLAGDGPLRPAAAVCCRRYAAEDDRDRLTLDAAVRTDAGKRLPYAVLEFKSTDATAEPPAALAELRPLKISKFLWATGV
jgi:hypothetical protein